MWNSPSSANEGPITLTDGDLKVDENPDIYEDGDIVDQPEGGFNSEASEPDFFVVIPRMLFQAVKTDAPMAFMDVKGTNVAPKDFDLNGNFFHVGLVSDKGELFPSTSEMAQRATSIDIDSRSAFLVDTVKANADPLAKADYINADTINYLMNTPGSKICFEVNLKIVMERYKKTKKVGEPVSMTLAMMLCGMLGLSKRPVFLGSAVASDVLRRYNIAEPDDSRSKRLSTCKAAHKDIGDHEAHHQTHRNDRAHEGSHQRRLHHREERHPRHLPASNTACSRAMAQGLDRLQSRDACRA